LYYFLYLWLRRNILRRKFDAEYNDDTSFLIELIGSIPPQDTALLLSLCDCDYMDQRLDIPVGWKNNPFRFFFGDLERPLAFMNRFIADFVALDELLREKSGFSPSSLLDFSLVHQDILIHRLEEITLGIDGRTTDSIVAPPSEFTRLWWQYLQDSWAQAFTKLSADSRVEVQVWLDKAIKLSERLRRRRPVYENMTKLFPIIRTDDSCCAPFPQMWLSHLINTFVTEVRRIASSEPRVQSLLSHEARIRMFRALAVLRQETSDTTLLTDVYIRRGETKSGKIDALLIVDSDKLVALESVVGIDPQHLVPPVSTECTNLSGVCELVNGISGSGELEIVSADKQRSWSLKGPGDFQVYPVMVVNQLTLDAVSASLEGSPEATQAIMLTDLEALSGEIQDALDLVRFLHAVVEIQRSGVKLIAMDFLDLWAWYRDNGHNFLWSARGHPNLVFVVPHWYSTKEMENLAATAAIRRLMIAQGIPERCKFLSTDENTVKLMDPISLIGVTVKTSNLVPQVTMVYICSRESESKDVTINESLSTSLLRRYEEIRDVAKDLIELRPVEVQERLVIWLYGESTVRSSQALIHLRHYLDSNESEPVLSKGTLLRDGAIGVAILYRDSLLELMGKDTTEGELLLIRALLTGIATAVEAPEEFSASIVQRINLLPGKGINIVSIPIGHAWLNPSKPRQRSPSVTAQVTVEISEMIASLSVKPGTYEGQDARDLVNHTIFPLLTDTLDKTLCELPCADAVYWLYKQAENASAYYQVERLHLSSAVQAMDIEFDLGEATAKVQKQTIRIIQAAGLAIERSAIVIPSGGRGMTREVGEHLLEYATALLELSQASERDNFGLDKMRIQITDDYEFRLSATGDACDLERWQLDAGAEDVGRKHNSVRQRVKESRSPRLTDVHPELKTIDVEFRNQFEYGLDDLLEVMAALSHHDTHPTDNCFPLVAAQEAELLQYLTNAICDFQPEQGKKALTSLTLEAKLLQEDWRPWLLKGRKHRFATHPLLRLSVDQYLFGPWLLEQTGKTWLAYLFEGRLPISDSLLSARVRSTLQAYRDRKNRELEDEVAAVVGRLSLRTVGPRIRRPEESWGCVDALPPGEIDLIVGVDGTRSLWVLEIKDPARTLAVDDIAGQLRDYYENAQGFQVRLERKRSFVQNCLLGVLSSMGISGADDWQVKAAFVTRYPTVAGYAKARKYPFLTLRNIEKLKTI
jgi:hypothetical protein